MNQYQFFTWISLITNKYKCTFDVNFKTNEISFIGLDDPVKQLQMLCEIEDLLGGHTVNPDTPPSQREVYMGAVKIKID